jgi:hypothetical protein
MADMYHVSTDGVDAVLVPKSKAAPTAQQKRLAERMQLALERTTPKLPKWRRYDDDGNERGYVIIIDGANFRNNPGVSSRTPAFTGLSGREIFFRPGVILENYYKGDGLRKVMPVAGKHDSADYLLAHEMGHTVDLLGSVDSALAWSKAHKYLSPYGRTDIREGYAEAFAEWLLGDKSHPAVLEYAPRMGWGENARRQT